MKRHFVWILANLILIGMKRITFIMAIILLHTTIALASPGILASSGKDGNWEIYLIDPATGNAKNLTNNPGDD